MPWPIDPERRTLAQKRHRIAQQRRWTPEAREAARLRAIEQFKNPAQRRRMSELKRALYANNQELRRRIAIGVSRYGRIKRARLSIIRARYRVLTSPYGET